MNFDDSLRFDPAAYALAQERVKSAPLDLTDHDFDQLRIISPTLETQAYEARRLAQIALVQPAPPLVTTKSATPPAASSAAVETMDEWLRTNGKKTVTGAVLMDAVDVLRDVLKSHKTRVKELEARVLELEAQAAARTVEHVQ